MQYNISDWNVLESLLKTGKRIDDYYALMVPCIIGCMKIRRIIPKGTLLYRARVMNNKDICLSHSDPFYGFDIENSMAPKASQVKKGGRINVAYESVLYTAEDPYTAMAEIRSGKKQRISIAEIELQDDIEVADFIFTENPSLSEDIYYWMSFAFYLAVNNDTAEEILPRKNKEKLLPKSMTDSFTNEEIDKFFTSFRRVNDP